MIQWFGNGFGHIGSTSNFGAMTPAAFTRSSTVDPIPSAAATARKIAPVRRLRFMLFIPPLSEVSYSSSPK